MINKLIKRQKLIAATFFGILYLDLVATLSVHATPIYSSYQRSEWMPSQFTRAFVPGGHQYVGSGSTHRGNDYSPPRKMYDIDGPGQPEMNSFKSAGTSDMVDLFTGDFSYNIPLLDVGGYPVNIHYASGISMDQEPSWVGLGWNINPGTVSRSMRGIPDDFNGNDSITREQSIRDNETYGVSVKGNLEITGFPVKLSADIGLFHNTYSGWGTETGINASINAGRSGSGPLTASLGISNNSQTGLNIDPQLSIQLGKSDAEMNGSVTVGSNYNSRSGISGLQLHTEVRKNYTAWYNANSQHIGLNGYMSFATPSITPTITLPITNSQYTFTAKGGVEGWLLFPNLYITGYGTKQYIKPSDKKQTLPAYGYLNYSKATSGKYLLDFNREKDIPYNQKTTPHIAIPQYTYDLYSISGEGTGGMFRPYRGDVGYISDHVVKTNSENGRFSLDFSPPSVLFHTGIDVNNTTVITESGAWTNQNPIIPNIKFGKSDSTFEEVYFRNPGEKSINASAFYNSVGGDSLVRVKLLGEKAEIRGASVLTKFANAKPGTEVLITKPLVKGARDKRTQVITYLNAKDSRIFGLDTVIRSYIPDSIPVGQCVRVDTTFPRVDQKVHKPNHISEIRVLNADGRRYVYGLPVYNVSEEDVTLAINKPIGQEANLAKGYALYTSGQNSANGNTGGKDHYYNRDSIPAYAHSFLITGLLSPDYIDVKGDGITDDDLGDAVKFNYTRVYGPASGYYHWRTPQVSRSANYNEGLKTYSRDDKGIYMRGEKEVWYMHSIESKTMIAVFKTSNRADGMSMERGQGLQAGNGVADPGKRLKKLDSIQLYVKADVVKNGRANARPIKTVHFEYNYELSSLVPNSDSSGKLTLKRIYFTYNGNNKGKMNPYRFYYHPDPDNQNSPQAASNPAYNSTRNDRWGTYKDAAVNPGSLNNMDYPYTKQDSELASTYASAWHLTDIKLPSGGRLNINYEADDYAYVQNKRAATMFEIEGFSTAPNISPSKYLYQNQNIENDYVIIKVTSPVTSKEEVYNKYLEGIDKFYFKVAVRMPSEGFDFVPTYGEIETYDVVPNDDTHTLFYVKLKKVNGQSPILTAAMQFLRLNLPSKAYPYSEPGDDVSFKTIIETLGSSIDEIKNSLKGFDQASRIRGWCKEVVPHSSFVRLDAPNYVKYGGGLRVKSIRLYDNWTSMTKRGVAAGLKESEYGQTYTYKTSKDIGGVKTLISSGVASYEPMIGSEENPFHTPIDYIDKVAPLAPTNYSYTETPLGESYFPSAMVGYSNVRVRTVNFKAKSANGWEETGFYTTKDFPTLVEFTPFDGNSKKPYNPTFPNFLKINATHNMTISQGFKVELNDMNGKMRSQASYPENDSLHPIHYTGNFYKVENDTALPQKLNNSVMAVDSANGHINMTAQIGKEVEVMFDMRQQTSTSTSNGFSPNIDIIPFVPPIVPFLIIPATIGLPQREVTRFRSVAVVKIVQRYGILDSMVVMDKGSVVTTKNLVYDGETGNVVLSRTNNEFNDPIYNFNYPAHWAYSGMDLAYKNVDLILKNKIFTEGKITTVTDEKFFESGDEIHAIGQLASGEVDMGPLECAQKTPTGENGLTFKLWAIAGEVSVPRKNGLYFIDEKGKPFSGFISSLRIIRSGKRNMTDASVGSVMSLASPIKEVSLGNFRIVIDSFTKVLNTSASTFKDRWKVTNSLYQVDSCYTITKNEPNRTFYPLGSAVLYRQKEYHDRNDNDLTSLPPITSAHFVASSYKSNLGKGNKSNRYNIKSVLKFDFTSIEKGAIVSSAILNLPASAPTDAWENYQDNRIDFFKNKVKAHYAYGHLDNGGDHATNSSSIFQAAPTNSTTTFRTLAVVGSPVHLAATADLSCDDKSANVTSIVSNFINNPARNYGFALILDRYNAIHSNDNAAEQTMSFCALSFSNTFKSASPEAVPPGSCINCPLAPTVTLSYTYKKDTCVQLCKNYITDTANPYRWGILGNWRMDRAYVFYHDRQESEAAVSVTNIRKEGELKSFIPYWNMTFPRNTPTSDEIKWVWNTAITQVNRKGFEIENMDPLGRYNSGLYGYNQTLPVAVAQNSKYRELLFDGFEDYSYKTATCTTCENPKEFDFLKSNTNATIQQEQSHTGRYSIKVNQNSQANLFVPISQDLGTIAMDSIMVDSVAITQTTVIGKGTKGLQATYSCLSNTNNTITKEEGPINFIYNANYGSLPTCGGILPKYGVTWRGKIQPKYTDVYYFHINTNITGANVRVNGVSVLPSSSNTGSRRSTTPLVLNAGSLYNIEVNYPVFVRGSSIELGWSGLQHPVMEVIPKANLYPPNLITSDTAGSVVRTVLKYCVKMKGVAMKDFTPQPFSPIPKTQLLVTGWINTNQLDCINPQTEAPLDGVDVSFDVENSTVVSLSPTGVPIEGWQRYEGVVNVPEFATKMTVGLKSNTSYATYFDDIRVQPYNSQMKSFVYDPVNLRLMAELDENNYASFYEYDDDGTLIRVKKETERGIKTIKETRSALFKE